MKAFVVCLLTILISSSASGQWEYGGKIIGQFISGYTDDLAVANVGSGSSVVAWNGFNNGHYVILAQRLDSAGFNQWPESGLAVYEDSLYRQHYPAVLADGEGGVFVVWSDWRHTWAQGVALYGQRLDSLGNRLWNPQGVRLTADTFSQGNPKLFDDGYGGFVTVYESSHYRIDIGAQRVSGDGQVLWDTAGIYLTHAVGDQYYPKTCKTDDSNFVTIWIDRRNYATTGFDIYMQKFNLAGNVLWDLDGIPTVNWSGDQGYLENGHDIAPDGHGGCVAVWKDERMSPPGHGALYANRFSPSGQYLWVNQGKDLGNGHGGEANECKAFRIDSTDSFMFRWEGGMNPDYFRFSALDDLGDFIVPEIIILDTFYAYTAFFDSLDNTFKYVVYNYETPGLVGRKCDISGQQFWPNYPFLSNDMQGGDVEKITTDGFGGMIFLWMQSTYPNIRITRIYNNGYAGGDTTDIFSDDVNLPLAAQLICNYPNPFNGETIVRYVSNSHRRLNIEAYNILGQRLFVNSFKAVKGGESSFKMDLSEYPSGTYFLRMTTDEGFSDVMPVTLLK